MLIFFFVVCLWLCLQDGRHVYMTTGEGAALSLGLRTSLSVKWPEPFSERLAPYHEKQDYSTLFKVLALSLSSFSAHSFSSFSCLSFTWYISCYKLSPNIFLSCSASYFLMLLANECKIVKYRVPLLPPSQGCQLSLTRTEFFLPHLQFSLRSFVFEEFLSIPGYVCLHLPPQNCGWQDQQFQRHHAQQTCEKIITSWNPQFERQNVTNLWNLSMAGNFKVLDLSSLRKALIFSSILHLNFSFSAFCLSSSLASYSCRKPINFHAWED